MLTARDAVLAALEDGYTRQVVRTLLPRGPNRDLLPLDETWTGGIMQIFRECAPLSRDLLRAVGRARSGEAPSVREQRIDESGVDGVAFQVAECATDAKLDASAFVQPTLETLDPIRNTARAAGDRLVLLCNPQFKELDDTLDFIASKAGLLGSLGNFLGGKAAFVKELADLGFASTFSLQEIVVKGTRVRYFLAYPYAWQIYAISDADDEPPIRLGEDSQRPDYNKVSAVLDANRISPKLLRDTGKAKRLVAAEIKVLYEPEVPPPAKEPAQEPAEEAAEER